LKKTNKTINDFTELETKDFYIVDDVYNSYIIHYYNGEITAFMEVKQSGIRHKNKSLSIIQQGNTLNDNKIVHGFTLQVFKLLSKKYKKPIMIDFKNSKVMEAIFLKWINNTEKYGIVDYFVYDEKLKSTLNDNSELVGPVWDSLPDAKRYSIVFDFYGYLNESLRDTKLSNENLKNTKLYFDGEI